jgi:hypothetical protein
VSRPGRDLERRAAQERLAPCDQRAQVEPAQDAAARAIELPSQRAARTEEQGLDRRLGRLELSRDLAVREPLPFAQEDRAPLVRRQLGERVGQALELVVLVHGRRYGVAHLAVVRDELDAATPPGRTPAFVADVLGDLVEPRCLGVRHDSGAQAAVGVQEGVLNGILGLLARREAPAAVAEDFA